MKHEDLIATLEYTGDYRVLRRLLSPAYFYEPDGTHTKLAIFLDLETTGLNPETNEIIEIAMVPFEYSSDGRIFKVHDAFNELQEPRSGSIPEEITRITGITDDMVRGHKIDADKVMEIVTPAALIIAHNASFDRKFAEKMFDVFSTKAWACSMTQVPWAEEHFDGAKLEYLAMKSGFFYDAHRAAVDCHAAIELLSKPLPRSGKLTLQSLLEEARKPMFRVWAEGSPFDFKDILKARGYRWSDGSDGKLRSWYRDVLEDGLEDELSYLRKDIFQRDADIPAVKITAFDRFSNRV
ncbi:3'-5' exonuclease [Alphaproteobacteria bacterium]|mgnify:FL=1|jgi:DNA polymerase-3 subunit epsilon|nr:3'-5' exonuclease [Alphaproteobacteria bacterium]